MYAYVSPYNILHTLSIHNFAIFTARKLREIKLKIKASEAVELAMSNQSVPQ